MREPGQIPGILDNCAELPYLWRIFNLTQNPPQEVGGFAHHTITKSKGVKERIQSHYIRS